MSERVRERRREGRSKELHLGLEHLQHIEVDG